MNNNDDNNIKNNKITKKGRKKKQHVGGLTLCMLHVHSQTINFTIIE